MKNMRWHLALYISFIFITVCQTNLVLADELKGHVQESGGKTRINRPPTPALDNQLKGYTASIGGAAKAESANLDQSNFHISANADHLQGTVDLSHWNPWGIPKRRTGGYLSSLQPSSYMLRPHYRQPFLHGDINDLAAVERAWNPSVRTVNFNGRLVNVRVTLALCRPGNPQLAQVWEDLMTELKDDRDNGDMWQHWQEQVCDDIASQANMLSQLPGNGAIHVRVTPESADAGVPVGQLKAISTPTQALERLVALMEASGRLQLPQRTNVSEAHIMIWVQSQSPYMPDSDRHWRPF